MGKDMGIAFHKKFIAGVAAAAIAVTALGSSQAQAGDYDTERALAAILGLAVIGAIIANERDDRHVNRSTRSTPLRVEPRPLPNRVRRAILPRQCLREFQNDRGRTVRVFGARCMERNYDFVRSLPRDCARRVRTERGNIRHAWGARCLRRNGYEIAARR